MPNDTLVSSDIVVITLRSPFELEATIKFLHQFWPSMPRGLFIGGTSWRYTEALGYVLRGETGLNDPYTQYECDNCGTPMLGYWRLGDLALCYECRHNHVDSNPRRNWLSPALRRPL